MPNVIISVCSYVLLPYIFQGLNSLSVEKVTLNLLLLASSVKLCEVN